MSKRTVIVHFHLFKNAGTSVDRILKTNFGDEWAEIEGQDRRKLDPEGLITYLRANPHIKAVSSHTAVVKCPTYDDIELLPIFFIRHPIDRIRSAYMFERRQKADTPGAIKAKEGDFAHYMNWRLGSNAPWQVSNFHAIRLKDFHQATPARQLQQVACRSHEALACFDAVGLVEQFDASMQRFADIIRPHFPDFHASAAWENRTQGNGKGLADNLSLFKAQIGESVYQRLEAVNHIDFSLYETVRTHFFAQTAPL